MRALFIANTRAGEAGNLLLESRICLEAAGLEVIEELSSDSSSTSSIIRRHSSGVDIVVVGGGDGTLNSAAEGLVLSGLPLAILPLGTANDLARTLGIPAGIPEAASIVTSGRQRKIDVGWVNGRYFFNVSSIGMSVEITRELSPEVKKKWGPLAYMISAARVFWRSRPFTARVLAEGRVTRLRSFQLTVGNGRYYGGGNAVSPDAEIDDSTLDLYSIDMESWWNALRVVARFRSGAHVYLPSVHYMTGQEFFIVTSRPFPVNTDGEITTRTPATFRVMPGAVTVMAP